jgi:hypothetical protein
MYSYGWRGLAIVDRAVAGDELTERLLTSLANYLVGNKKERRWRPQDYTLRADDILKGHGVLGRLVRDKRRSIAPVQTSPRLVRLSIGLDDVSKAEARAFVEQANELFKAYGIVFTIHRLYQQRLKEQWNWPLEIKRMHEQGDGDIFMLLTSSEWISPKSGLVRGIGSAFVGAIMVQVGDRHQTVGRLAHEIGHLFGLSHTFLDGHIMYPSESRIGLSWSPGSIRLLKENRLTATWQSVKAYPQRIDAAIKTAPPMTKSNRGLGVPLNRAAFARADSWAQCS